MLSKNRIALIAAFLNVAHAQCKAMSDSDFNAFSAPKIGPRNYFTYMGCSFERFIVWCENFTDGDIELATQGIINNDWDQHEFIMGCENLNKRQK